MLAELALSIAESTNMLQEWSQQRFGPQMAGVADEASEVMALLDAGILDIDASLQEILSSTSRGIQQTLDETAQSAEKNKQILDDVFSTDWDAQAARNMSIGQTKDVWVQGVREMYMFMEEEVPQAPFDPVLSNFENIEQGILSGALDMALGLDTTFGKIDQDFATSVQTMLNSMDVATTDMQKFWLEKIVKTIEEETPKRIVVEVEMEVEGGGGTGGKQHGGPVPGGVPVMVGEGGPELFIPGQGGNVIPNWKMNMPALLGTAGGTTDGTTGGAPIQITMNPVINNQMDMAEFQARTLQTVKRALRGA